MSIRIIIIIVVVGFLATGCDNHKVVAAAHEPSPAPGEVIKRDVSINAGNAYNDLFLDSNDVRKFIAAEQLNDTLANALRSFYNVRNFEYAWFSSEGLIEQSLSFRSLYKTDDQTDLVNRSLEARLDRQRIDKERAVKANDAATIKTELQLSLQFIRYGLIHFKDMGISTSSLGTFIPVKKKAFWI